MIDYWAEGVAWSGSGAVVVGVVMGWSGVGSSP